MFKKDSRTFVERVLAGDALGEDISDFVDYWHEEVNDQGSLAAFLGFSEDEYGLWVENPDALSWILTCRQQGISFEQVDWEEAHQLAARGPEGSENFIRWLTTTGRLKK